MPSPTLQDILLLLQQVDGKVSGINSKVDLINTNISQVLSQNNQILSQISGLSGFSETALDNLQLVLSEVASTDERTLSEKLDLCETKLDNVSESVSHIDGSEP